MQINRYLIKIVILIVVSLFLGGCALTPQVELDNFLTDLDVECRFEEIAFDIEFGRWSDFFQKNITVLMDDLGSFETADDESKEIVDDFIESAELFLLASKYYYNEQKDLADDAYNNAKSIYDNARRRYHYFVDGY